MFISYIYDCGHESQDKTLTKKRYRCPICHEGYMQTKKYRCQDCGKEFTDAGKGYRVRCPECQYNHKRQYDNTKRRRAREYARKVKSGEIVPKKKRGKPCSHIDCAHRTACLCSEQFYSWKECVRYEREELELRAFYQESIYDGSGDRISEMELFA